MSAITKTQVPLDVRLLPSYQSWRSAQSGPFTLWNYIDARGDVELAAAFSKLFYPDFVEIDHYIFLAEQFEAEAFNQWRRHFADDRQQIEAMMNHVHIYDLFNNNPPVAYQPALYQYLGKLLATCWEHALHDAFPAKHFSVRYTADEEDYGPTITFFQTP